MFNHTDQQVQLHTRLFFGTSVERFSSSEKKTTIFLYFSGFFRTRVTKSPGQLKSIALKWYLQKGAYKSDIIKAPKPS